MMNSTEINNQYIHVAFVRKNVTDSYNCHNGATMVSILDHCSRPVFFHIICSKLNDNESLIFQKESKKYIETVAKFGGKVEFHFMELDQEFLNEKKVIDITKIWGTNVGFFRLYLPNILPDVDKVFSFGVDVIVNTDLAKLQDGIPDSYSIAGANEGVALQNKDICEYLKKAGLKNMSHYVCADAMFLNLKKIRSEKTLPEKGLDLYKTNKYLIMMEQDTLNLLFHDDCYVLPQQYGITSFSEEYTNSIINKLENKNDYIIHYSCRPKPWDQYVSQYDNDYWKYKQLSAWKEDDLSPFNDWFWAQYSGSISHIEEYKERIFSIIWNHPVREKLQIMYLFSFQLIYDLFKKYFSQMLKLKKIKEK